MRIKDRVMGRIEGAVLSAAIGVLVFFVERRLKKAIRKQEVRLGSRKAG